MKIKTIRFTALTGVLALIFVGLSVFFASQGLYAAHKKQEFFDVYRLQAEEYIKSSAEITGKYGEDISVNFDNSVTYYNSGERKFYDRYIEVFFPQIPKTLEEFNEGIDMIKFKLTINGEKHEITFEKNEQGKLYVSNLVSLEN